jgi:sulfatase maturation enzyme AslB (radical SAM superfamily)
MYCPRLDHYVKLNPDGTLSRCGHMINPTKFTTLEALESSTWLTSVKNTFAQEQWPVECQRCEQTEKENGTSIRLNSVELDQQQTVGDYLQVGGVLDNLCNAGCLTCGPLCSTRIGSLTSKVFPIVNNTTAFYSLPQDRILHLDINGGEPSYSKNYKRILKSLPPNLKTLRLNTNCSTVLWELNDIAKNIDVTVTVSFDGVGPIHDLVRWPISWEEFYKNLMIYKTMPVKLNLWTTVNVLNVDDLPNIIAFAKKHNIGHSYAYLKEPSELAVENKGTTQSKTYIQRQFELRQIKQSLDGSL